MNDAILSYHMDPHSCGVAKFNLQLAEALGVHCYSLFDRALYRRPLISIKFAEITSSDLQDLRLHLESPHIRHRYDLFIHDAPTGEQLFDAEAILKYAQRIYAANEEIRQKVPGSIAAFCPSTLRPGPDKADTNTFLVFCCGMVQKFSVPEHQRLKTLLEGLSAPYLVRISGAIHEGTDYRQLAKMEDSYAAVYGEDHVEFLGYLSDRRLIQEIALSDLCALFYDPALRENNTLAHAVLDAQGVLITNCDQWTPDELNEAVIDIATTDDLKAAIGANLREALINPTPRPYTWEHLLRVLSPTTP